MKGNKIDEFVQGFIRAKEDEEYVVAGTLWRFCDDRDFLFAYRLKGGCPAEVSSMYFNVTMVERCDAIKKCGLLRRKLSDPKGKDGNIYYTCRGGGFILSKGMQKVFKEMQEKGTCAIGRFDTLRTLSHVLNELVSDETQD